MTQDKTVAKKDAGSVDPAVVEGIVTSMVPIPDKDYRMGRFPVTQAQWEAVTGGNPSEFKGADRPVEMVSWADCRAFLETLNATPAAQAAGLAFRLPKEDEWEYACRAGSTGKYCRLADGTEITEDTLGEVAWFDEDVFKGSTHPVGMKKPNAFGLYDMHGNVSEWTDTAVDEDGLVDAGGKARVNRGGAWGGSAKGCMAAHRRWFAPSLRSDLLGFRLCADRRAD
jgi:formylglycine-generating enzyme required for sulfatase activity